MRGALAGCVLVALLAVPAAAAQSVLERPPGLQGTWGVQRGHGAFVLGHRFEFTPGAEQLFNVPTLTFALGLPAGLTAGLHYTSTSEIDPARINRNETELWLKRAWGDPETRALAVTGAWNRLARSFDGALGANQRVGPVNLHAELRGFSDLFARGEPGAAGAAGAALRLTPLLSVVGDIGSVFEEEAPLVWSAGLAIGIPASPHTLSLHATNGGATTLQGASHRKVMGNRTNRYGFAFTAPLGSGSQWLRIFRRAPPGEPASPGVHRVEIRMLAYAPAEIRIRAGETVEWVNRDPIEHTVTGDGWGSELLEEGERFRHRFERPGTYRYLCLPHPMMEGVVVVEP